MLNYQRVTFGCFLEIWLWVPLDLLDGAWKTQKAGTAKLWVGQDHCKRDRVAQGIAALRHCPECLIIW